MLKPWRAKSTSLWAMPLSRVDRTPPGHTAADAAPGTPARPPGTRNTTGHPKSRAPSAISRAQRTRPHRRPRPARFTAPSAHARAPRNFPRPARLHAPSAHARAPRNFRAQRNFRRPAQFPAPSAHVRTAARARRDFTRPAHTPAPAAISRALRTRTRRARLCAPVRGAPFALRPGTRKRSSCGASSPRNPAGPPALRAPWPG